MYNIKFSWPKSVRIWKPTFNTASLVQKKMTLIYRSGNLLQVLGNDSLKPAKLKLHLSKCHPTLVQKDKSYFERHLSSCKRLCLDSFRTYHERTTNAVRASYIVAYKVAQAKNPHTIVEQLLLPFAKEMVRLVVGEDAARNLIIYPYLMTLHQDVK